MSFFQTNKIYKYSQVGEVPSFVKQASVIQDEDLKSLPSKSFADAKREFPIHTKQATWLSYLKSASESTTSDAVKETIIKAAEFWGIADDIYDIEINLEKSAAPTELDDTDFAVVVNEIERRFPLTSVETVKAAGEGLWKNRSTYPMTIRKEAAKRIIKKAKELKVNLDNIDFLEKTAGYGVGIGNEIKKALSNRRYITGGAPKEVLTKAAEEITTNIVDSEELQEKIATILDTFDREHKIYRHYDHGLRTPEEVCYGLSLSSMEEKIASELRINNKSILFKDLATKKAEQFRALGDDFVNEIADSEGNVDIEKISSIVPTLPKGDLDLFCKCV